jgi:hypothetical protein
VVVLPLRAGKQGLTSNIDFAGEITARKLKVPLFHKAIDLPKIFQKFLVTWRMVLLSEIS